MSVVRLRPLASVVLLLAGLASIDAHRRGTPDAAWQDAVALDAGQIIVSVIERPVGRERYEIRRDRSGVSLSAEMDLVERGGRLQMSSSMRLQPNLTPVTYRSKGSSYRFVNVDVAVDVLGEAARVQNLGADTTVPVPGPFFIAEGYAPIAGRALLIRYWERLGKPARLAVLPGRPTRDVTIEFRGEDTVRIAGRDVRLRRFMVDGVVWGRESVWLDADGRFAALTSRIHILPLEAIRDDLAQAQPALLAASVADRVADLIALGRSVTPIATGDYALVGARVIDGTDAPARDDTTVVVRDGRITAVGPRASTSVPRGIRVVDATGTTIVPGLWDMHAHASQIEWAGAYLGAGVTSIRDMGGEFGFLTAFRDAIATGRALGPHVYLAGLVDGASDRALGAIAAATPDEGRAVVDRYKAAGFDQMKLYSLLPADVARAIISRTHEVGMTVTGHIPTALGLAGAIDAGMDHIAHAPGGARDLSGRLADRRVVIDPTMPWGELLGHGPDTAIASFEPGIDRVPEALRRNYLSVTNQTDAATFGSRQRASGALVKTLFDAGVPIVVGTDGAVPGYSVLRNLEQLVDAGFTPLEAIQAATIVPASAMRVEREVGTIEVGKRADLLVLDANPLEDIRHIRRSRWVGAAGRLYRTSDWWRAFGFGVQ